MSVPASPDPLDAPHAFDSGALRPLNAQVSTREYLEQMWGRRSFALAMPLEEVRSSHQNTLLGNVWHLGNPLLSVAVYYLVFGIFLKARGDIQNYVLWLMVGVFAFGLTQRSVLSGATAITASQGLMRSIRFPRALLPFSIVIGRLLTFGFELAVLAVVAVFTGAGVSMRWLALPLVILVHTVLNLGGAFIAARLNDSYRDVQQLIPFLFRLLMYVSGVMFPIRTYLGDGVNPAIKQMISWNPLVGLLDLYRAVFLGTPVDVGVTLRLVVFSVVILLFGFRFFRAHELDYGRA
jgi:teichoic acid transport system permease protein